MRSFLILCAVVSGLAALLFGATGLAAPGLGGIVQMNLAASSFGSLLLCAFGAAVLGHLERQDGYLAMIANALTKQAAVQGVSAPATSGFVHGSKPRQEPSAAPSAAGPRQEPRV